MNDLPCKQCILLALCKGKKIVECDLLYDVFIGERNAIAFDSNYTKIQNILCIFPMMKEMRFKKGVWHTYRKRFLEDMLVYENKHNRVKERAL